MGNAALLATVHPSSILRAPPPDRDVAFAGFVRDLEAAAAQLQPRRAGS